MILSTNVSNHCLQFPSAYRVALLLALTTCLVFTSITTHQSIPQFRHLQSDDDDPSLLLILCDILWGPRDEETPNDGCEDDDYDIGTCAAVLDFMQDELSQSGWSCECQGSCGLSDIALDCDDICRHCYDGVDYCVDISVDAFIEEFNATYFFTRESRYFIEQSGADSSASIVGWSYKITPTGSTYGATFSVAGTECNSCTFGNENVGCYEIDCTNIPGIDTVIDCNSEVPLDHPVQGIFGLVSCFYSPSASTAVKFDDENKLFVAGTPMNLPPQ